MSLSPLQQCGVMTGGRGAGFPDPKVCALNIMLQFYNGFALPIIKGD